MARIMVVLIGLLLAATGCSTEGQDKPSGADGAGIPTLPAPGSPAQQREKLLRLTDPTWQLEAVVDTNGTTTLPTSAVATVAFTKKAVRTHTGCNSGGGRMKISDDTLAFGPLMSTLIGCPERWKQQVEQAYGDVLRGRSTYVIEENRLTISKGESSLEFVAR